MASAAKLGAAANPASTKAAHTRPNFSADHIVIPALSPAPDSVPAIYQPPARPRSSARTSDAISPPVAAEVTVHNATAKVASTVKVTRPRDTETPVAKARAAAVQNPLSTTT